MLTAAWSSVITLCLYSFSYTLVNKDVHSTAQLLSNVYNALF